MARTIDAIAVYLEAGQKRTFAGALDWPGWCRRGHDEAAALQALVDYGSRYAQVLRGTKLGFHAPGDVSAFSVVERLDGNDATDFGAANLPPARDADPLDEAGADRFRTILRAVWRAFDGAIEAGTGKSLSTGPRGGGRDLDKMLDHVLGADASYIGRVGQKVPKDAKADPATRIDVTRSLMLDAIEAGLRGEIPERGPRGGAMWTARYFVRRVAWHTLDHAWEIEDRVVD